MHSYVVRVYRVQEDHPQQLVGVIEQPGHALPLAFSNIDELWEILSAPASAGTGPATGK
jgi:hypothetical protein